MCVLRPSRRAGHGQHAAELAAAQDADGGAGRQRRAQASSSTASGMASVWRRAIGGDADAEAGIVQGEDLRRQQSGVGGAGLADRQVPTGTPAGIWTMESRLSRPLSAWLSIGTPSTGSSVIEAVMPGRWAAPPAPAMITLSPRSPCAVGVGVEPLRRAVRRDDLGLVGDAELLEHVGGVPSWSASRTGCP